MSSSAPPARTGLQVRNVVASYDGQVALHGISIDVPADAAVAVLGSNGAGKTTLLNVIAGLHRPDSGTVHLGGSDITRNGAHRRARSGIAYVPEGRGVFRDMTVAENLRLAIGSSEQALELAVAHFPVLGARANQLAGTLSGGEQQMLAMAPALVNDNELLLVDELSLGLAPIIVDRLFEKLSDLRGIGKAILLVEQFADRALRFADHAYVIRKGTCVYSGPAAELHGDVDRLHHLYLGSDEAA
jgi:branched-chain amino acid transport system ATP-binding protein